MEMPLNKSAVDFFQRSSNGQSMSALVFFDDKIGPHIDHRFFNEYLDAWFSTLINEYEKLDENIKKLIIFEIDDNDIFTCPIDLTQ